MTWQDFTDWLAAHGYDIKHPKDLIRLTDAARVLSVNYRTLHDGYQKGRLKGPAGQPLRVYAEALFQAVQPKPEPPKWEPPPRKASNRPAGLVPYGVPKHVRPPVPQSQPAEPPATPQAEPHPARLPDRPSAPKPKRPKRATKHLSEYIDLKPTSE